jgi:hypothetical protein
MLPTVSFYAAYSLVGLVVLVGVLAIHYAT